MRLTTNRANGFELMLYSAKRMTQRLWASWSRVLQVHKPKQSKANNVAIIIDVDHKNSSDVDQFLSIEAKLKWATTALPILCLRIVCRRGSV